MEWLDADEHLDYYEPVLCPVCMAEMEWVECYQVGCEDGYYDAWEDDPLWYSPGETERCETCQGKGGWLQCLNLPHETAAPPA